MSQNIMSQKRKKKSTLPTVPPDSSGLRGRGEAVKKEGDNILGIRALDERRTEQDNVGCEPGRDME